MTDRGRNSRAADNASILREAKELDKHYKCAICLETLKQPRMCTNCSGLFCEKCASSWTKAFTGNLCPKCRSSWGAKQPVKCRVVDETIKSLDKMLGRPTQEEDYAPETKKKDDISRAAGIWEESSTTRRRF